MEITVGDNTYYSIKAHSQTGIQQPSWVVEDGILNIGSEISFRNVDTEGLPILYATVSDFELWDDGYWYMVYFVLDELHPKS